jgi:hypothetical protein
MSVPRLNKNNSGETDRLNGVLCYAVMLILTWSYHPAVKRIMQEARELANDPSTEYSAAPLEVRATPWSPLSEVLHVHTHPPYCASARGFRTTFLCVFPHDTVSIAHIRYMWVFLGVALHAARTWGHGF